MVCFLFILTFVRASLFPLTFVRAGCSLFTPLSRQAFYAGYSTKFLGVS